MKISLMILGIFLITMGLITLTLGLLYPKTDGNLEHNKTYNNFTGTYNSNNLNYNNYYDNNYDNNDDENNYSNNNNNAKKNVKFSGVIMIGPIPIVFGNSPSLTILSILITIAMMVWIFLFYNQYWHFK